MVRWRKAPASVIPGSPPVASAPQTMFPEASVSRSRAPVQLGSAAIWRPPAVSWIPPAKVEVPVPRTVSVEVAMRDWTVVVPAIIASPCTANVAEGELVATPSVP